MAGVQRVQRRNQAAIQKAVARIPGLSIPVYPSSGKFLVIECLDLGLAPEALEVAYQAHGIMIRQGHYHTPTFGDRFVKVSTTVPEDWMDKFCELLLNAIAEAREVDPSTPLF